MAGSEGTCGGFKGDAWRVQMGRAVGSERTRRVGSGDARWVQRRRTGRVCTLGSRQWAAGSGQQAVGSRQWASGSG
ncbi:hypothetical protein T492DRAFT_952171 [Pavlovales sp. CCMP2436]|nr:hypothetical protein T492DRAFT_952171 [Pavlovales sp. CCMP2436]